MENRKTAGAFQLLLTILTLVFLTLFICSQIFSTISLPEIQWGSGILTVFTVFYFMSGGFYYIELSKADDHFEIKFYNSFPFSRQFKMYRIPIAAFIKYDISGSKLFKRKLILYQMSSSQMAKYPPIYISAMSKKR